MFAAINSIASVWFNMSKTERLQLVCTNPPPTPTPPDRLEQYQNLLNIFGNYCLEKHQKFPFETLRNSQHGYKHATQPGGCQDIFSPPPPSSIFKEIFLNC